MHGTQNQQIFHSAFMFSLKLHLSDAGETAHAQHTETAQLCPSQHLMLMLFVFTTPCAAAGTAPAQHSQQPAPDLQPFPA
jgi:hypothetical protein